MKKILCKSSIFASKPTDEYFIRNIFPNKDIFSYPDFNQINFIYLYF